MAIALLALLAIAAMAQASVKPGSYSGTTSEHSQITFGISGHKIAKLHTYLGYNGSCGQGGGPGYIVSVTSIAIEQKGNFSAKVEFAGIVKSIHAIHGIVSGSASGSAVRGTIKQVKPSGRGCKTAYSETFTATLQHK